MRVQHSTMRTFWQTIGTVIPLSFALASPVPGDSMVPPPELVPNLRQALPAELSIRVSATAGERERAYLGFRSAVKNVGAGPLVINATRTGATMEAHQAILRTNGSLRSREGVGVLRYQRGGGHSHWHLQDFERYELIGVNGDRRRRSRKVGFCLGDRLRVAPSRERPATSAPPRFTHRCGLGRPDLRALVQGISSGYADFYREYLEGQSVDVTTVQSGLYVLRHTVNPNRTLAESDYSDNAASMLLRLRRRDRGRITLSVIRRCPDRPWCAPIRRRMRASATAQAGQVSYARLRMGGRVRTYRLFVPSDLPKRASLLVALHGGGLKDSGRLMAETVGLDADAAARRYIVAYPDAVSGRFNAGRCCNVRRGPNDVAFIDELVMHLGDQYRLDRRRIFAAGFSNGGFMAYRLACQRAETFAAIAVVAATEVIDRCRPSRPVSVLHIHAQDDPKISYGHGRFGSPSIPGLMRVWRRRNGCTTFAKRRLTADLSLQRSACSQGTEVQLLTSATSGHSWPGALPPYGKTEQLAFSATVAISQFLATRQARR